jgi:glutathione peroxidase-family protein
VKKPIDIKKFDKIADNKPFTTYKSIHDISVKDIAGKTIKKLGDILKGKKLTMIVNVASKCGLTKKSYTLMSELYKKFRN